MCEKKINTKSSAGGLVSGPIDDECLWGCGESERFIPPPEVAQAVAEDIEIAIEFPEVHKQAVELTKKSQGEDK